MDTFAKQDVHWDRIPVEGNLRRYQFRCLLQNTVHCSSWQNADSFKKHFQRYHKMIPESTRRGRPGVTSKTRKKNVKHIKAQEKSTDINNGNFPLKWWRRKTYQMSLILQKVLKQQTLKGERDPTTIMTQTSEYYKLWRNSEDAKDAQRRLAASTVKYWVEQNFDLKGATKKGEIPEKLGEFESEDETPLIEMDGELNFKIARRKRKQSCKNNSSSEASANEAEIEHNDREEEHDNNPEVEEQDCEKSEPEIAHEPALATPGVEEPSMATLGVEEPDIDTLGVEEPAMVTPEVENGLSHCDPTWPNKATK